MSVYNAKLVNSESISSCKVVSKYFSSNRVMDESLLDFKEKKSAKTGPKTIKRTGHDKAKKKPLKGQKDIRAALKGKQNDLLKYTEEFDKVCKKSGLDVGTEQLLLAVALSKSLQDTDHSEDTNIQSSSQHSQERRSKIRTTLQEYGFTVPEIKINKKSQKHRKNYCLLKCTDTEKQQIISDKYAQVLLSIENSRVDNNAKIDYSNKRLFFTATNISYKEIQCNDVFYVANLLEKSTSTGSLLRNWSDIPGRPTTPTKCEEFKMNFSEIECSQDELDIILSGSLKMAKNTINKKIRAMPANTIITVTAESNMNNKDVMFSDEQIGSNNNFNYTVPCNTNLKSAVTALINDDSQNISTGKSDKGESLKPNCNVRSSSPDIFDEVSVIDNEENKNVVYSQLIDSIIEEKKYPVQVDLTQNTNDGIKERSQSINITRRISNDVMEITECIVNSTLPRPDIEKNNLKDPQSQGKYTTNLSNSSSQCSNKTKRISNDFMEITECIIDKTLILKNIPIETNIDLTQNSDEDINADVVNKIDSIPQVSYSDDKLPYIQVPGSQHVSLDDTILLNDDEIDSVSKPVHENESCRAKDISDVKSYNFCSELHVKGNCNIKASQSFFDEFEHNHSDETTVHTSLETKIDEENENKIDLTQSSEESAKHLSSKLDVSGPGKEDEISVDYDELYDGIIQINEDNPSTSKTTDNNMSNIILNNDRLSHSKISSEESDELEEREFNYSRNMSKRSVAWNNFGGISIMDDLSKSEKCRESVTTLTFNELSPSLRKSMSDSFLPVIEMKENALKSNVTTLVPNSTPRNRREIVCEEIPAGTVTPTCSDYIIKTDQVTPMLDYTTMSTPERNRELNKYGLKPLKRKRAIQLLTHLYNQTHPLVESSEVVLSPTKKRKIVQPSPEKKSKSPKGNVLENNKENNLYAVTKEIPDISDIECLEEDWMFQKREKAKVASCRVPLHIAFHNYVSCRQKLREAILRYEPINIDVIHKELVSIGLRYDPKDLLKFMDKKCITVKTADNGSRNNRRY